MGEFRIGGDEYSGSVGGMAGMLGGEGVPEYLEADFDIDDDGNVLEFDAGGAIAGTPLNQQGPIMHSDAAASAGVRENLEEGQQGGAEVSSPASLLCIFYVDPRTCLPSYPSFLLLTSYHSSTQTHLSSAV